MGAEAGVVWKIAQLERGCAGEEEAKARVVSLCKMRVLEIVEVRFFYFAASYAQSPS